MRIGFIGAGKVATAFGRYLHSCGIEVSGFFDRQPEKTDHAGRYTESRAYRLADEVAADSDIVLIATQDDQIAGTCRELCLGGAVGGDHLIGHMSGAHASSILSPAADLGAAVFSLHPLQAFAEEEKAVADLSGTYFSLEGTDNRLAAIEELLNRIGNPFFRIAPRHKSLYHLAACILSNYLVTLLDSGMQALTHSGIDPREGLKAMMPLIESTIANVDRLGPAKALTGPIARGDASTLRQHMKALQPAELHEIRNFYAFLGMRTLSLATQEALPEKDKAEAVERALSQRR